MFEEYGMKKILDWKEYENTARQAIAEGCVLIKNDNNVLPLSKGTKVSVFGRIQTNYYKSGTGSGGKVNVAKVFGIVDGLEESGDLIINKELQKIYTDWEKENPYDEGLGWGQEKWSQEEMTLSESVVKTAAQNSDVAIIIIGRTAGEDKDNSVTEGSYLLTKKEEEMMTVVRSQFKKVVVLLNVGNIMDMSFVQKYTPDSVMYVWQGGMLGGLGVSDIILGKVNPCGKLTDTIAQKITDYPSDKNFGDQNKNYYAEDIYVGYRYFETFAKDKVIYPFGFGLSYSSFETNCSDIKVDEKSCTVNATFIVKNTGKFSGKEVVQLYVEAPCGKLGKPSRVLTAFKKTAEITPGATETLQITFPFENFASYDDSGITGNKSCFVLEAGEYKIYGGSNVRSAKMIHSFTMGSDLIVKKCEEALAPVESFERMVNENGNLTMKAVPVATVDMDDRRKSRIPEEIKQTEYCGIKMADVVNGKSDVRAFVAQFTDEDLACIVRGEGMGSALVTPGTAAAFGGVSPRLQNEFGLPACCCDDGPSGMRLDCGIKAFALPNGTSLACTFNTDLVKKLYSFTGLEMCTNNVENLLGPGMNIHRHPLNGRNFEYFSEDPLLTGLMGSAMVQGLQSSGVTGTIKHFCGNNQETRRHFIDSVISERALREIYLKGFEIAVRNGADSVMTTYGIVNGLYTSSSYDLNTTILRDDWGFKGIVMTDWWANINERGKEPDKSNFAAMIRSQNDLYMVCPDGATNAGGDNTLESIKNGAVTRAEVQRCAVNICNHVAKTVAMKRLMKTADEIEVINKPKYDDDVDLSKIESVVLEDELEIDLSKIESNTKASYVWQIDVQRLGKYSITLTGSSELGELAQLPCAFLKMGIPEATFTFNGTGGKDVSITKDVLFWSRFQVSRLLVGSNGLKLKSLKFKFLGE